MRLFGNFLLLQVKIKIVLYEINNKSIKYEIVLQKWQNFESKR